MQENSRNDESNHSENLYSYNDNDSKNNDPPKESTAIRRSIGREGNPFRTNISNEINNKFSNNINHIQTQQINNNERTLSNNNQENLQSPNYDKSSEQRLPPNNIQASQQINQINHSNSNNYFNSNQNNNNYNNNIKSYISFIFLGILQIIAVAVLAAYKLGDGDPKKFGEKDYFSDYKDFGYYFHYLKDVHLMIFIGFGLLYCSLKNHMIASTALVLFVCLISFEFSLCWNYLWNNAFKKKHHTRYSSGFSRIKLDMEEITQIDFFATTVLISLGSLIGKLTLGQYFIVIFCETLFASLNYFICYFAIGGIDTGGSLYIFAFGALFGFIVSFVLAYDERFKKIISKSKNNKSSYYSNVFSAIGSLFLWLYFPSFNTARIHYDENKKYIMDIMRYRGIINTYMSMIGSLVASFCTSSLVITERKFKMEHILRGSYVGGVIIAGCCTFCAYPWAALLIGFFGGIVSVLLIHLATPKEEGGINPEENSNNNNINHCLYNFILALRMSDTMGVIYCFGVPGILGGIFTLIFLGSFNHEPWKKKITLANGLERTAKREFNDFFYYKRTPSAQVGIQIGALFITIVIAICSGIITGFFMKVFDYSGEEIFFMDNMIMEEKNYVPEYNNKKILSSSENKLNNDDNEEGREVEVNQENNNNNNYYIK